MNGSLPLVVLAAAAWCSVAAGARTPARADAASGQPVGGRTLWATSGRCVGLDRQAACREAQAKARQQLLVRLNALAAQLGGRPLRAEQLLREQLWLVRQSGVEAQSDLTVEDRPYGPVAEKRIALKIPPAVVAEWSRRLAEQDRRRTGRLLCGAGGTLIGWLAAMALVVWLDRATGGYYRWLVMPAGLALTVAASLLGWMWLLAG